jgi:alkaline phosphatase D
MDRDAGDDGFKIYASMFALNPSFFVHTGDIVYYDRWAKSLALARWGWARMYSLPTNFEFHRKVPSYFMKDDHDTWINDVWPRREARLMGDFTFEQGQAVFLEQVPMGDKTYRTFRWGKDVQIWLVEGRDYRSANTDPDGPNKTIWGAEQLAWFKETVQASDATFRILISPTPLVGPDQDDKSDNHANEAFAYEGRMLREFIAQQDNMIVICGDRHWQYVSIDDDTGLREYGTGPASDEHASGWDADDYRPEHRYLNVVGGYLAVTAERRDGAPTLLLHHYSANGEILNEDILGVN